MFLAMLSTTLDDIPLKMFKTREDAQCFIDQHDEEVPDRVMNLIGRDRAEPCCFLIAEFDADGELVSWDNARELYFA